MEYERWYDKDQYLSPIMKILEQLPSDIRQVVAEDLLQTIMSFDEKTCDSKIEYLNKNIPPTYRRWYDTDINLHSAVESLKNMSDNERRNACDAIIEFLVQFIAKKEQLND